MIEKYEAMFKLKGKTQYDYRFTVYRDLGMKERELEQALEKTFGKNNGPFD